jgi:ABC-type multidrug transport system permease subunit
MTNPATALPRTPLERLRWAVTDAWVITQRDLLHWASQPGQIAILLLFPVLMVLMFGYLFGGGMSVPGGGSYREFLLPGLFAMTMVFGVESTFAAVATDAAKGVTDRFRSIPMAGSAVVAGRAGADMLSSMVGLALMIGCGLLVGWRARDGFGAALVATGLLLLLRFALLWVGIFLGLLAKGPEALVAVQILVWPLGFLSSAFVAPDTMPGWLGTIAEWNPLSATVTASRELFGNPGWGGDSWIVQHSVAMAIVWPVLLTAIFLPLSVHRDRRLSR